MIMKGESGQEEQKEFLIRSWSDSGLIKDTRLINAFRSVQREHFVTKDYLKEAYADYPLPIHAEQTISQPTTVMIMLQALELSENDKVLDIGAGSGYNAALISKIARKVISIEIVPELAAYAKGNLKKARIRNVKVVLGDGSKGYGKEAPYDKIIVTAACPSIPEPLIGQLKENGIMIAPIGDFYGQKMIKGVKKRSKLESVELGDFSFVPLKGEYGYDRG